MESTVERMLRQFEEQRDCWRDIARIAADAYAEQTAFLTAIGLTWEQARAMTSAQQDMLQDAWTFLRSKPCWMRTSVDNHGQSPDIVPVASQRNI